MATYTEIRNIFSNTDMRNKTTVACIVAAEAIRNEAVGTENHANRLLWAKAAFSNPTAVADKMLMAMLAANKDASAATILGATDTAIQNNVNAAVDLFADGS